MTATATLRRDRKLERRDDCLEQAHLFQLDQPLKGVRNMMVLTRVMDGTAHLVAYPCKPGGGRIPGAKPIAKGHGILITDLLARNLACKVRFKEATRTATLIEEDKSGTVEYKRFRISPAFGGDRPAHTISVLTNHLPKGGSINRIHMELADGTDFPYYEGLCWTTNQALRTIGIEWPRDNTKETR